MFIGVSVVLAVFSYLAYRHLTHHHHHRQHHTTTDTTPPPQQPPRSLIMWPFISTVLSRGSGGTPEPPVPATSPDTTPKALQPVAPPSGAIPQISLSSTTPSDDDEDDVPSFPARNSAQRAAGPASSLPPQVTPTFSMPPPPIPNRNPKMQNPAQWRAPPAAAGRLAVVGAGAAGVAAGGGLTLPRRGGGGETTTTGKKGKRGKVVLEPGHSPLDWARLLKSGLDLRGLPHSRLLKVPPSLLSQHKTAPDDVWMALNGKVYNVSAYIPFHPGGEKELLRAAGKDGTKMFNATHPWVNIENMLEQCLVGVLVSEEEAREEEGELERVD